MPQSIAENNAVRSVIRRLLAGKALDAVEVNPGDLGAWADVVASVEAVREQAGLDAARRAFREAVQLNPKLAALVAAAKRRDAWVRAAFAHVNAAQGVVQHRRRYQALLSDTRLDALLDAESRALARLAVRRRGDL